MSKIRLLEGDHTQPLCLRPPQGPQTDYQGPCLKAFALDTALHGALVSHISILLLIWVNSLLKCHLSEETF